MPYDYTAAVRTVRGSGRQCSLEGCERELGAQNKLGRCMEHRDFDRYNAPKREANRAAGKRVWHDSDEAREAAVKLAAREWRQRNPEAVCDASAIRRARKTGNFVERVYRSVVWRRDAGSCHLCGLPADPLDWHLEHVVPLSRGGEHSYANTAVSHPLCNMRKGSRCPEAVAP